MASGETTASRLRAEIRAEQAHIDRAYARIDALTARARDISTEVIGTGSGITRQAALEREAAAVLTARRLQALRIGDYTQLCFGRIDCRDGDRFYIGRFGVSDENDDPLVVDWRAPVAAPFYRATGSEPMGLVLRRHFLSRGRTITGLDDEVLDGDLLASGHAEDDGRVLAGEAALLAALGRARTGRMGDIVATIQGEQDNVIRAPLAGVLVVQGGPGTGKTAVALHRAAYLLYSHRFPLESARVLFVGPNATFLRYVEHVLPSLGEESVQLATPAMLVRGVTVAATDDQAVATVKASARMVPVIRKAVRDRERRLARPAKIPYAAFQLELGVEVSARIVATARRREGTHNARRPLVERLVGRELLSQYRAALERDVRTRRRGPEVLGFDDAEARRSILRTPAAIATLDRMWPVLTPEQFLTDLYASTALLRSAARDVLADDERDRLARARPEPGGAPRWSEHDVALLDEADELLGDPPPAASSARSAARDEAFAQLVDRTLADSGLTPRCPRCDSELTYVGRAGSGKPWECQSPQCADALAAMNEPPATYATLQVMSEASASLFHDVRDLLVSRGGRDGGDEGPRSTFGHVLVDEAQDLSPMQWRMLARRCPSRSMTIVGDLGQASRPWAPPRWPSVMESLGIEGGTVAELTVNYRTPVEVMDVAAAVLAAGGQDLEPPRSVRSVGVFPRAIAVGSSRLRDVIERVVDEERAAVEDGKVAVVTPSRLAADVTDWLDASSDLEAPLVVLPLDEAKGLEFDSVVLVEPSALVAETEHGLRSLYVALTRTTTRLALVHTAELPEPVAAGLQ